MNKPVIFISHITEEKEIALKLKEVIEDAFLGQVNVFVSSDPKVLTGGSKWLDLITKNLSECCLELILCSEESVKRSWINFEAGAGWIRKIPVIPLCHSGMIFSKLPTPINELQGYILNDEIHIKSLVQDIANSISSRVPTIDYKEISQFVKNFENNYTLGVKIRELGRIFGVDIIGVFKNPVDLRYIIIEFLESIQINKIREYISSNLQEDIILKENKFKIINSDKGMLQGSEVELHFSENIIKKIKAL